MLRQFRIYRKGKLPFAFVSWAYLTEEAEQGLIDGTRKLQPGDWNAGDRGWIVDFIAPFGGVDSVVRDLRHNLFPNARGKATRRAPDGSVLRVMSLRGANVRGRHGG